MEAVVEGIETLSQRNCLVDMGARVGQGYLCAKPMSLEEFDSWKIKLYQRFQTLICNLK
jgi:EAL domain-containing protein (putative c-di-GMP-specific phosphodiesterase class I)